MYFRDQCYDLKNIFTKKFGDQIGAFFAQTAAFWDNFNNNIGFCGKTPTFCRKLAKIVNVKLNPWCMYICTYMSSNVPLHLGVPNRG
jgi:hypothetical protein